jgi:hypothetical protein
VHAALAHFEQQLLDTLHHLCTLIPALHCNLTWLACYMNEAKRSQIHAMLKAYTQDSLNHETDSRHMLYQQ